MRISSSCLFGLSVIGAVLSGRVEAAPPGTVQPVEVVNPSLDVFVGNEVLDVEVAGPVVATGPDGGAVGVVDETKSRAWHVQVPFEWFSLDQLETVWCVTTLPDLGIPSGYRFVAEQVNAQLYVATGQFVFVSLLATYTDAVGANRSARFPMVGEHVGPFPMGDAQELWIVDEPIHAVTDGPPCISVEVGLGGTGLGRAYVIVSGYLVPEP